MSATLVVECDDAEPIPGRKHWLAVDLTCPGCGRRHGHGWDRRDGPGISPRCPPCDPPPGRSRLEAYYISVTAELLASSTRKRKRPAGRRSGRRRPKIGLAAPTPQIGLDGHPEGIE
jgi:hypothetical protein